MISTFIRFAKRFAVLLPGIVVAYLSIFNIFPWLNDHLPIVAALILTYILGAYVLIPALIRLYRILFPARHVPMYCVTGDGFASDPLNIAIIGTRQELLAALTQAGWFRADKLSFKNGLRLALSTVYGWNYKTAPMSSLYLFGRAQDVGFQLPIGDAASNSRHHVRFWAASYKDGKKLSVQSIDWQHRQAHLRNERLLWIGAASRDIGVTFIRHNAQLTHLVDADTNSERDLLADQLTAATGITLKQTIELGQPYKLATIRGWRGHLHTDGRMKILEIKAQKTVKGSDSPKPRR